MKNLQKSARISFTSPIKASNASLGMAAPPGAHCEMAGDFGVVIPETK